MFTNVKGHALGSDAPPDFASSDEEVTPPEAKSYKGFVAGIFSGFSKLAGQSGKEGPLRIRSNSL